MSENPQQPRTDAADEPNQPAPLIFRITPVSLLAVLTVTICATPIGFASPSLLPIYLLPLLLAVWILRTRTVVDSQHVIARTMLGRTRFGWDEVRSFRLDEKRWLRAVLDSGKEVRLPAVRVRDVPLLSALSGGRLPDPLAEEARQDEASES